MTGSMPHVADWKSELTGGEVKGYDALMELCKPSRKRSLADKGYDTNAARRAFSEDQRMRGGEIEKEQIERDRHVRRES
jgi:hypothetical protein